MQGELAAGAGPACDGFDLYGACPNFRHLLLKEVDELADVVVCHTVASSVNADA
jgi:hypothetical protein